MSMFTHSTSSPVRTMRPNGANRSSPGTITILLPRSLSEAALCFVIVLSKVSEKIKASNINNTSLTRRMWKAAIVNSLDRVFPQAALFPFSRLRARCQERRVRQKGGYAIVLVRYRTDFAYYSLSGSDKSNYSFRRGSGLTLLTFGNCDLVLHS